VFCGCRRLRLGRLTDPELLERQREFAALRREIDAGAARLAAEVARRSARELGHQGLAQREAARSPEQLLERLAGATAGEARALVRVGELTVASQEADSAPPIVAAVAAGELSVRAADAIRAEAVVRDPRTTSQLMLDAFVDMVRIAGAADRGRVFAQRRPGVSVHVDRQALVSGVGAAALEGSRARVSIAAAQRVACASGAVPIASSCTTRGGGSTNDLAQESGRTSVSSSRSRHRNGGNRPGRCRDGSDARGGLRRRARRRPGPTLEDWSQNLPSIHPDSLFASQRDGRLAKVRTEPKESGRARNAAADDRYSDPRAALAHEATPGSETADGAPVGVAEFALDGRAVMDAIETVVDGKREVIELAVTVLLAEGHLLVEDVPGVGKTMLARALAKSVDGTISRIQFTPDLLPSDITGVSIYDQSRHEFEFKPGPIFANLVIGDEINRASPKTQSALLESMEERQVSIDGTSRELPDPFIVIATQNPIEMEGTYALPEAQRDRFMARVTMGYPDAASEAAMLRHRATHSPLADLQPVISLAHLRHMVETARRVFVSPAIRHYAVALVSATRDDREIRLGASPRATLQLARAAKARAALNGRDFVLPDDIDALAAPVLAHRLVLSRSTGADRGAQTAIEIMQRLVATTPVPLGGGS
tara:strand:- start:3509 stop:5473 length:1965 start_codon:yes stop_codon:yes gene_type:complete